MSYLAQIWGDILSRTYLFFCLYLLCIISYVNLSTNANFALHFFDIFSIIMNLFINHAKWWIIKVKHPSLDIHGKKKLNITHLD